MNWTLMRDGTPTKDGIYLVAISIRQYKNSRQFVFLNEWSKEKKAFSYELTMSEKTYPHEKIYAWCEIPKPPIQREVDK